MSSSTAELMAEYSPPIPKPVMTRKLTKDRKLHEKVVSTTPARYTANVMRNSFLRPTRSVR